MTEKLPVIEILDLNKSYDKLDVLKGVDLVAHNPFIPYPILAGYFILVTVLIIWIFGCVNRRLNRHLPESQLPKRPKFQLIR